MAWYWSLASVPELASLTKERRKELWKKHAASVQRSTLAYVVLGAIYCTAVAVTFATIGFIPRTWPALLVVIPPSGVMFGLYVCLRPLFIHATLPAIRMELGLCQNCGYDLRATPDPTGPRLPRCPECGRAVVPEAL